MGVAEEEASVSEDLKTSSEDATSDRVSGACSDWCFDRGTSDRSEKSSNEEVVNVLRESKVLEKAGVLKKDSDDNCSDRGSSDTTEASEVERLDIDTTNDDGTLADRTTKSSVEGVSEETVLSSSSREDGDEVDSRSLDVVRLSVEVVAGVVVCVDTVPVLPVVPVACVGVGVDVSIYEVPCDGEEENEFAVAVELFRFDEKIGDSDPSAE
ncbi:hypothetical protein PSN45_004183 [Yamadazyma tenuis]|uniref:uncharacterized protein n=1 Tax=Candida tenuis TaxID=2315449 RepID=UPI0027983C1C|nr:hypothetical protein PSN45_004183 [Yamadazyma tenuis]